ncbi:MAG: YifB family Mg chelatase-like AAA ATPase [Hungatella sp.]
MFSSVYSVGIRGIDGYLVQVEVDSGDGLPGFSMVGVLASEVRESQDRVRTALKNSGYRLPAQKVTVNLSPADQRKGGTGFDLPIALAVLASFGVVETTVLKDAMLVGELGLDGEVKPIRGILPMVMAAKEAGLKRCFLPKENAAEGTVIPGIDIVGIGTVKELVELLYNPHRIIAESSGIPMWQKQNADSYEVDYAEVNGQLLLRRATEVAVAGQHNILYIGSAGTGKTMVAQRIPTIMPSLSIEETLEISKVYSICGMLPSSEPILSKRPFRSPHHSISPQAFVGGGRNPKPGELSLATRGVLFLDELPEFQKHVIETLRQPMEEHKITISRVFGSCEFPANFMLVAAMNPCNCGYYPDRNRCNCSESQIKHYLSKVSKPILDRIDICVEAAPIAYEELKNSGQNEASDIMRGRVEKARSIQEKRFAQRNIYFNSEMNGEDIRQFCKLTESDEYFFQILFQSMRLSARAYSKILKVARTIADLEGAEWIAHPHLCEAIGYRSIEDKFWGGTHEPL